MAPGTSPGKSIVLLAAAVALVCVALLVLFGRPAAPPPSEPEAPLPAAAAEPTPEPAAPAPATPEPMAPVEPPSPEPPAAAGGERQPEAETEAPPGDESAPPMLPSGVGLFPPPGTDPIKVGIAVPDDFELPEGYLRHYQVTDDGQELEPILLFHPDYELLDDAGKPVPLPPDRVVPPELAPPGMPIRPVEVPKPLPEDGP